MTCSLLGVAVILMTWSSQKCTTDLCLLFFGKVPGISRTQHPFGLAIKYDIGKLLWLPLQPHGLPPCTRRVYGRAFGHWWALQQRFQLVAKCCCRLSEETVPAIRRNFCSSSHCASVDFKQEHARDSNFARPSTRPGLKFGPVAGPKL